MKRWYCLKWHIRFFFYVFIFLYREESSSKVSNKSTTKSTSHCSNQRIRDERPEALLFKVFKSSARGSICRRGEAVIKYTTARDEKIGMLVDSRIWDTDSTLMSWSWKAWAPGLGYGGDLIKKLEFEAGSRGQLNLFSTSVANILGRTKRVQEL